MSQTSGKRSLSENEAKLLLSKITVPQDKLLISLAINTGMRREDLVSILVENIILNEDTALIHFWEKKKQRMWRVSIAHECFQLVKKQVNIFPKEEKWLFPSYYTGRSNGNHISGKSAYNILHKWLVVAELKKRPFHSLRATFMKLAKGSGFTDEQIIAFTGVSSSRTMEEHYLTPTDNEMEDLVKSNPPF